MYQGLGAFLVGFGTLFSLAACSTLPQTPPRTDSLEARADAIALGLSQIRGLGLKEAVPVGVKDKSGLRDAYQELIEQEWTEHDDGTERAYKLFGLLPEEMNLKSYLLDLYSAQVAGYYDPRKGEFFVVETSEDDSAEEEPEVLRSFVLAHELVHALQDQHFDLEDIHDRLKLENDRGLASVAVIEGDAMLAASDHMLWQRVGWPRTLAGPAGRRIVAILSGLGEGLGLAGDSPEARQLRDAPAVIRSELFFAYLQGTKFISTIRAEFGWEGVDALFRDLPDSTEQILHPERYIDHRDRPVTLRLAEPPSGWRPVFSESLGMLTTQVLLREHLGRWGGRAAKGWDGDRYVVWETPNGVALGWLTVWDRCHQARRFARAYRKLLKSRLHDGQPFAIVRRGHAVAAVEGGSPTEAEAAASLLLQSRIERSADDRPPQSMLERWLTWPLSARRLDRVFEVGLLGGHLFRLRSHARGHQLSVLFGLLGRSERSPDRRWLSTAGGLLWASGDRNHAYRAGGLTPLIDYHTREVGSERQADFGLARLPFLGPLLSLQRGGGMTHAELLRGLVLRLQWGPRARSGQRVRVLMIPIPGL